MKKRIGLLLGVLLLIGATGCGKEPQKQDMTGAYNVYEGYLTVKDNQLIVDEIKFIDLADKYLDRFFKLNRGRYAEWILYL